MTRSVGRGLVLLRYGWTTMELGLDLVLTGLVSVLLLPRVQIAADQFVQVDATLVDRPGRIPETCSFRRWCPAQR